MSTNKRPWYKWFPKDFNTDEKVQSLGPISELVYRRLLDIMWQANACLLLNVCSRLLNTAGRGLTETQFKNAWDEIQTPGYELFKTTEDGKYIYSKRLYEQLEHIENVSEIRKQAGKIGGKKKRVKQKLSKCQANAKQLRIDTDTDIKKDKRKKNYPPCPYQKIISMYHAILPELPQVKSINGLKNGISARWKEDTDRQNLEWWTEFFMDISKMDFLMGRKKDFKATLSWIVGPKNFEKVLNGQYISTNQDVQPEPPKEFEVPI